MKLFTPKKSVLLMIAITLLFSGVSFADCIVHAFCSDYTPNVDQPLWFYGYVENGALYACFWDAAGISVTSGQFTQYLCGYYTTPGTKMVIFKVITDCGYMESDPMFLQVSE